MRLRRPVWLALALALGGARSAAAQFNFIGPILNNRASQVDYERRKAADEAPPGGRANPGATASSAAAGAPAALAEDALQFSRDPAVSRRTRERAAAEATAGGGFRTFLLRTAISSGATEQQFARLAGRYGLRADDAGDAVTLYVVGLWQRAHVPEREPAADAVRGVRAQVRRMLAADAAGRALADPAAAPARQELGETFAHRAALGDLAREAALKGRDATALHRLREDAAAEGRRVLGVDVRVLTLGPGGLAGPDLPPTTDANGAGVDAHGPSGLPPRPSSGADPAPEALGAERIGSETIAAVVLEFTNVPGTMFSPRILYRDGRVVDPPDRGPDDRGRWNGGGRHVTVRWESGRVSRWDDIGTGAYFYARPGAPDQRLSGTFRTVASSTVAGTTAFSARAVTFRPDGAFTLASAGGGFGPNGAAGAERAAAGRYRIDGWTITFAYADGRTERGLFYRYPDSETTIGIGTPGGVRTYSSKDD